MKKYQDPQLDIVLFTDIITTSGNVEDDDDGGFSKTGPNAY